MFGLLGKKFTGKCKYAFKCIRMRMMTIKRKKQSTLRFLRQDIAELIINGLDVNAYSRMDALIVETNNAVCYDMIEKFCEYIKIQLPTLQKQKECPHEAMEAVSTLIFAAARFPDLPELCDLRRVFSERYGSYMESSVNTEFVEKIQKKTFSTEKKLRLMQEIAQEFAVTWDFKAFEQKISNSSAPTDRATQGNGNTELPDISSGKKEADTSNENISFKDKYLGNDKGSFKERYMGNENITFKEIYEGAPKGIMQKQVQPEPRDIHVVSGISNDQLNTRKIFANNHQNVEPLSTYFEKNDDENGFESYDKQKECNARSKSTWARVGPGLIGLARDTVESERSATMNPPYTKPNTSKAGRPEEHQSHVTNRTPAGAESRKQERQPAAQASSNNDRAFSKIPPPYTKPKVNLATYDRYDDGKHVDRKDELLNVDKAKPFSVRTRQEDQHGAPTYDDDNAEKEKARNRGSKLAAMNELEEAIDGNRHIDRNPIDRRHGGRRSTGSVHGEDEEERAMDRLLMHYSKKRIDNECNKTRTRTGSMAPPGEQVLDAEHQNYDKIHHRTTKSVQPERAASFQPEPTSPKEGKGTGRASSMQPEGGRVHPRLPDYEEFAARLLALRKA